jgi:hypothetical protein
MLATRPAVQNESGGYRGGRQSRIVAGRPPGYGGVLVNWTFSVKALFAGQLFRLHRQSAELCGCPYRAG